LRKAGQTTVNLLARLTRNNSWGAKAGGDYRQIGGYLHAHVQKRRFSARLPAEWHHPDQRRQSYVTKRGFPRDVFFG